MLGYPELLVLLLFLLGALIGLAIWIWLLVWVSKDAKARGLSGGAWVLVTLFFGLLGLIIYLVQRPSGPLVPCPVCKQMRLANAFICPHCLTKVAGMNQPQPL